jgi:hypothetical protein
MVNKKNGFHWSITIGPLIGVGSVLLYWFLYGTEWLGRLLLGAIIFVSFTSTYVIYGFNKIKNRKIGK